MIRTVGELHAVLELRDPAETFFVSVQTDGITGHITFENEVSGEAAEIEVPGVY